MTDIDIKRIRYFIGLSETLNFSQAARNFGVSQPALTKAVQRLEQEVGGALVRREGKHTHLTPLGKVMLEQFRELDASATRVERAARRLVHGDMPQLQIAVMCTIGPNPLAGFLADYRRRIPDLEIVLRDAARGDLAEMLLSGMVDVSVVGAPVSDEQRFRYIELYRERMVVACAPDHPFAERRSVDIEEVLHQPYIDRLLCEFRDTFLAESRRHDFEPVFAARSEREEWTQMLIQQGMGVSIVPERSIMGPGVASVPLSDRSMTRTVFIAVPTGREDTPIVRAFLDAIRKHDWTDRRTDTGAESGLERTAPA